ncbi:hypothetical protein [Streptomyces sp. NPDC047000]|uniref:hypothetical protein n=1 Tax=Streptomyces sp. NPDC047000 TaxID=3155474 RepID=UPI0033C4D4F6
MAELLFPALVPAPFLTPWVVLFAAVALARRLVGQCREELPGGGRRLLDPSTYTLIAVIGGTAAFGAYAWGVMSGFYLLDPDQMCAAQGVAGDRIVTRETLPVSAQCVTSDGVGTELVPAWVNPVIFLGLALLVLALVAGTLAALRRRPSPR